MDESKLLAAACADRAAFHIIERYIQTDDLTDKGRIIWEEIDQWYKQDEFSNSVDKEVLIQKLTNKFPKHAEIFTAVIGRFTGASPPNIIQAFIDFRLDALNSRLIQSLAAKDHRAADALMQQYNDLKARREDALKTDTTVIVNITSDKLTEGVRPDKLVRLYPANLNDAVEGGLPNSAHALVFAPTEVGKSLFCINMASGMLHDGHEVLYIGNEDPAPLMLLRFKSRLSGMTKQQIIKDPKMADERANANGFGKLTFAATSPGTVREIANLVDEYHPRVVFVDQLHNLYVKGLSKVEKLEYLAQEMRNIAKSRDVVVVSVTQAADSGIGKLFLEMGDVYFSNVAIQSQVDLMIGIGMDNQAQQNNTRVLSLCKNKLTGNHQPLHIKVDPHLSKAVPDASLGS